MNSNVRLTTGLMSATALATVGHVANAEGVAGNYAGLSFGSTNGDSPWNPSGYDYELSSDIAFGLFVGRNWSVGNNLFAGVELAFQSEVDSDDNEDSSYPEDYSLNYLLDAKARLGTMAGENLFLYGFVGLSGGDMSAASSGQGYTAFGYNAGVGAEYNVNEQWGIGLEYIHRSLTGYGDDSDDRTNNTIAVRALFRF